MYHSTSVSWRISLITFTLLFQLVIDLQGSTAFAQCNTASLSGTYLIHQLRVATKTTELDLTQLQQNPVTIGAGLVTAGATLSLNFDGQGGVSGNGTEDKVRDTGAVESTSSAINGT